MPTPTTPHMAVAAVGFTYSRYVVGFILSTPCDDPCPYERHKEEADNQDPPDIPWMHENARIR